LAQPGQVLHSEQGIEQHASFRNKFLDSIVYSAGVALTLQVAPYIIPTSSRIYHENRDTEIKRAARGLPEVPHNKAQKAGGHVGFVLGLAGLVAQTWFYCNNPEFTPLIGATNVLDFVYEYYLRR